MKLFSRTSSPISLDPPSPSPRTSPLPSSLPSRTPSTASSLARSTPPPSCSASTSTMSTSTSSARTRTPPPSSLHPALHARHLASRARCARPSPPRRPRLRHGAPPFLDGWMGVRSPSRRKHDLRFCTLAGPVLSYSASPSHDIMSASVCVYGAAVSADEFPSLKIVIRPRDAPRLVLYPESRPDHNDWVAELSRAASRCLTDAYAFRADLRPAPFGRVSAAQEKDTRRMVDVKVVSKTDLSKTHVAFAKTEAAILSSLPEHACVPNLVDVYESARTVYLVTDHLPGPTLTDLVAERGALCEADVAAVVRDVLAALDHVHAHGVAHRLVCPDNVVVDIAERRPAARVRGANLVNFEMAVASLDVDDAESVLDSFSENGPLYLRHAMYLAPEVARGGIGDFAQDVWSLGVLMHYLLVGCTPFDSDVSNLSGLTAMIGRTRGTPTFSGKLWRGVTNDAKHLCAAMLHGDPHLRVRAGAALRHRWFRD